MAGPWEKYAQQPAQDGPWSKYSASTQKPEPSMADTIKQGAFDLASGAVRGAGSIGATILEPVDYLARKAGIQNEWIGRTDRRQAMDEGLNTLGANPESLAYKTGKFGAEVAGTSGVGGIFAKVATKAGAAPALVNALNSGGLSGGGNMLTRASAGAATGAATAGMVNPDDAATGAVFGAALPVVVRVMGSAGEKLATKSKDAAKSLMQSAVKPTLQQLKSGEADTAVNTLLEYGLSPNKKGVEKLKILIDEKNQAIADLIANSKATVGKENVLARLSDTRKMFGNQVSPTADMAAIQGVADDFMTHPLLPGSSIPVQRAQELKQGTYRVLAKKYGQMGGAETEAQKGIARGLKEEIAAAVPEVGPLNAEESKLLATLNVTERRALMELNKNPMGLAALALDPRSWAAFMADRSATFKALAARQVNRLAQPGGMTTRVNNLLESPAVRSGLVLTSGS